MGTIKSFEDLECWKLSNELRKDISVILKTFPDMEKHALVNQMYRSSRSVTDNIAEGYGRFHYQDNIRFCVLARGSIYELLNQILIARDECYIEDKQYQELRNKITRCIQVINGFINYLKSAKANTVKEPAMDYSIPINDYTLNE